jgi:hypothetical protein
MLRDTIMGNACVVSDVLIKKHHAVLAKVYSACFGELWAAATCRTQRPPPENWSVAMDLPNRHDSPAPEKPLSLTSRQVDNSIKEQKHLTFAVALIKSAVRCAHAPGGGLGRSERPSTELLTKSGTPRWPASVLKAFRTFPLRPTPNPLSRHNCLLTFGAV